MINAVLDSYRIFFCKKSDRVRSDVVRKFCLPSVCGVAWVLWLVVVCCSTDARAQPARSKTRRPHSAISREKDPQCPSGQRCAFTFGCESKGKCIVPSGTNSCIDPAGRCGCDRRRVDIFCEVGSRMEYASAPVNAAGPCPRPCAEELGCVDRVLAWCARRGCTKPCLLKRSA